MAYLSFATARKFLRSQPALHKSTRSSSKSETQARTTRKRDRKSGKHWGFLDHCVNDDRATSIREDEGEYWVKIDYSRFDLSRGYSSCYYE